MTETVIPVRAEGYAEMRHEGRAVLVVAGGGAGSTVVVTIDLDRHDATHGTVRQALIAQLAGQARRVEPAPVGSSAQPVNIDVNLSLDGLRERTISKTRMVVERDARGYITGAVTDGASDARIEA